MNPFLGILRASFLGASLPEKLPSDWIRIWGQDQSDNALAESVIGLYKAQLVHVRVPWRGCEDLELATLEWVEWFNHHRLFSSIGYIPPAEYEAMCYPEPVPAGAATQ